MLLSLPTAIIRHPSLLLRGGAQHGLLQMSSHYPAAVPAALAAPLATSLGVHVWDMWGGSAFALNGFKCTMATILFGVTLWMRGGKTSLSLLSSFSPTALRMLLLSSFVGIIIGDLLWLRALQLLGAQDTIVMSALHPVIAWFAGTFILKQGSSPLTVLGLLFVCVGVVCTQWFKIKAVDRNEEDGVVIPSELNPTDNGHPTTATKLVLDKRLLGYTLNFINILLDVFGSVLTRRYGGGHSTFEICFLRFGFASIGIATIALVSQSIARLRGRVPPSWAALPKQQSTRTWLTMGGGVLLVTYLSPSLGNYALFGLPLAVWTALGSLGPVYSIPIKWIREGEGTPTSGVIGAALATGGCALLGFATPS